MDSQKIQTAGPDARDRTVGTRLLLWDTCLLPQFPPPSPAPASPAHVPPYPGAGRPGRQHPAGGGAAPLTWGVLLDSRGCPGAAAAPPPARWLQRRPLARRPLAAHAPEGPGRGWGRSGARRRGRGRGIPPSSRGRDLESPAWLAQPSARLRPGRPGASPLLSRTPEPGPPDSPPLTPESGSPAPSLRPRSPGLQSLLLRTPESGPPTPPPSDQESGPEIPSHSFAN